MIAVARGLGDILPEDARLARDPFGIRFATGVLAFVARHAPLLAPLIERIVLGVQLRTRVIDDLMLAFIRDGGDQIVLLGAGFDCRAARFVEQLRGAHVFEVDHPSTQAVKRARLASAGQAAVSYLSWDFEQRAVAELPDA